MKSRTIGMVAAFALLTVVFLLVLMNLAGFIGERRDEDVSNEAAASRKTTRLRVIENRRSCTDERVMEHVGQAGEREGVGAPRPEASVPIAFLVQEVDMNEFTAEENEIIHRVQKQFAEELAGPVSKDPGGEAYAKAWKKAQWRADNRLRLELGAVAFNRFNSLAAQQAEMNRRNDGR